MTDCYELKLAARGETAMITTYFGPLDSPLYKTHVETSLLQNLMSTWRFIHTDNEECAKEMEVDFAGISLFRQFDYDFL